jgi:DNA repair protein RadC
MDITPLVPADRKLIQGYGGGGFRVNGERVEGSILIAPEAVWAWAVMELADLSVEGLGPLLERTPRTEILLLGTGKQMSLVAQPMRQRLREMGIVLDVMDTGAACRTYNVLLAEERRVAAALIAVRECCCRYLQEKLAPGQSIRSPTDSREFLLARLRDRPHEVFCCLFLDNRHRILAFDELFQGTIDNTTVYPREVVRQALRRNAAAVILAHNHPSGVAEPSEADQLITRRIRGALELIDVRLLDHFAGEPRDALVRHRVRQPRRSGWPLPARQAQDSVAFHPPGWFNSRPFARKWAS